MEGPVTSIPHSTTCISVLRSPLMLLLGVACTLWRININKLLVIKVKWYPLLSNPLLHHHYVTQWIDRNRWPYLFPAAYRGIAWFTCWNIFFSGPFFLRITCHALHWLHSLPSISYWQQAWVQFYRIRMCLSVVVVICECISISFIRPLCDVLEGWIALI